MAAGVAALRVDGGELRLMVPRLVSREEAVEPLVPGFEPGNDFCKAGHYLLMNHTGQWRDAWSAPALAWVPTDRAGQLPGLFPGTGFDDDVGQIVCVVGEVVAEHHSQALGLVVKGGRVLPGRAGDEKV